jgi:hypothetical protein
MKLLQVMVGMGLVVLNLYFLQDCQHSDTKWPYYLVIGVGLLVLGLA